MLVFPGQFCFYFSRDKSTAGVFKRVCVGGEGTTYGGGGTNDGGGGLTKKGTCP